MRNLSRRFHLTIAATTGREFVAFLRHNLYEAHAIVKPALRELSIALVGNARMGQLHREFLGDSNPTDVLSFPLEHNRSGQILAGEVVVCVPEAKRQARKRKLPPRLELLLYCLHGMLHLSGFDDTTNSAYRKMHRTEDNIMTRLGFGPVFDRPIERMKHPPNAKRRRSRKGGSG